MSIFTQSFVNFLIKSLTEGFHTGINPLPTIPLESQNEKIVYRQGKILPHLLNK